MRQTFLLIENPVAGLRRHRLLQETVHILEHNGARIDAAVTTHAGHATDIAREAARLGRAEAVIVAGGDGSIREAAKGLIGSSLPLGIIPSGTGNVLGHELELGHSPDAIARYLMNGATRRLTPHLANGEPFLLMVGVGFDADVVAGLDRDLKQRIGRAAYGGPVLRALLAPLAAPMEIVAGTRVLNAHWAIIARASRYGGNMRLLPRSHLFDDRMVLLAMENPSRFRRAGQLLRLPLGRLANAPGVTVIDCDGLSISAPSPLAMQVDGDWAGPTPLVIEPGTGSLELIVP